MPTFRIRLERGERVEFHEVEGPDVLLGSDPDCDLCIHDRRIQGHHARVFVRRSRIIVMDLTERSGQTEFRGDVIRAPVALSPRESVTLGGVRVRPEVLADGRASLVGAMVAGRRVVVETESPDREARRYRLLGEHGVESADELVVFDRNLGEELIDRWERRLEKNRLSPSRHVPQVTGPFDLDHASAIIEHLPPGVRLSTLLAAKRRVQISPEAAGTVVAHLAVAIDALHQGFGPHGSIAPDRVHLGVDGLVSLLRPGPLEGPSVDPQDTFLGPERRMGLPATRASDAYAYGALVDLIVRRTGFRRTPTVDRLLADRPDDRPTNFEALAGEMSRDVLQQSKDPSSSHIGRTVRVLFAEEQKPLASSRRPPLWTHADTVAAEEKRGSG